MPRFGGQGRADNMQQRGEMQRRAIVRYSTRGVPHTCLMWTNASACDWDKGEDLYGGNRRSTLGHQPGLYRRSRSPPPSFTYRP